MHKIILILSMFIVLFITQNMTYAVDLQCGQNAIQYKQKAKEEIQGFKESREQIYIPKPENWFSYDRVILNLQTALKRCPDDGEIILLLGKINSLFPSDKTAYTAIKWLNKYILQFPNEHEAYVYRGKSYYRLERYALAIDDFTQAYKIKNEDILLYFRAISYWALKEYTNALNDLLKLKYKDIYIQDQYGAPWYCHNQLLYEALGDVYYSQKNYLASKDNYELGLYKDCKQYDLYTKIAIVSLKLKFYNVSEKYFTLWLNDLPRWWDKLLGRSIARFNLNNYQGALSDAIEAETKMPDEPKIHFVLGLIYQQLGDRDKAILHLNKSLSQKYPNEINQNADNIFSISNADIERAKDILQELEHKQ